MSLAKEIHNILKSAQILLLLIIIIIMEIDFWRCSERTFRKHGIRNTKIREIMQVDRNVSNTVEERRLKCYGNVFRITVNEYQGKNSKFESKREKAKRKI